MNKKKKISITNGIEFLVFILFLLEDSYSETNYSRAYNMKRRRRQYIIYISNFN